MEILSVALGGIAGAITGLLSPFAARLAKSRELRESARRVRISEWRALVADHHQSGQSNKVDVGNMLDDPRYFTLKSHLPAHVISEIESKFERGSTQPAAQVVVLIASGPGLYGTGKLISAELDRLERKWRLI